MKAIDLFAGIGGNTDAAIKAGLKVVWAANHSPLAVHYHGVNHPDVDHACQDLQQANWSHVPAHDFGLASPCCKGHTNARGKEGPHHYESRSTAWAPVSCWEYHKPSYWLVENVPEFRDWNLYPQWKSCMETLGYSLSEYILDAADHGVPQNRERLFIIGTRSTHPLKLKFERKPHVAVDTIIDWDYEKWSPIEKKGRAVKTLERVANGRKQFGDRFVMPYYSSGSGKTGRALSRPVGTVTTIDRWAVVDGDRMRMFSVDEYRKAMSFDKSISLPSSKRDAVRFLGNATCPVQVQDVIETVLRAA